MLYRNRVHGCVLLLLGLSAAAASAQLRLVTWNISVYSGGRTADIQNVIYGVNPANGLTLAPDIIMAEEMQSAAGVTAFLSALNTAANSPGDWAATSYFPNCDTAVFYRTSKVALLGSPILVSSWGSSPNPPRDTYRYTLRPVGYAADSTVLCLYGVHMKAGTASDDQLRRNTEAQRIRANAATLNAAFTYAVLGDFNIYNYTEAPYQTLTSATGGGRFFDPINSPGAWHTNSGFRFIHTQDPVLAGGGMDDRFDQILVSANLRDGVGFDYIGSATLPYSTTAWNDVNHSYRAWGNDGTSYDQGLNTTSNSMVGNVIATSIVNAANGGGHIPVYLDLRLPAVLDATPTIDFGTVTQGAVATQTLAVANAANVALWSAAGIANLSYTLTPSAGFNVAADPNQAAPGVTNYHAVAMDTSTIGPVSGTIVIASNAADQPTRTVTLIGNVAAPQLLVGDLNCDHVVDFKDINPFVLALSAPEAYAAAFPGCDILSGDANHDGVVDFKDINPFVTLLSGGGK